MSAARLGLLASAVAGRTLAVAPGEPGAGSWTDGRTIFVDAGAGDDVAAVAVQAALLSAGSLDRGVVRGLARHPALARRYLAVEGHRALQAAADLLPPRALALIDQRVAARADSPAASLAVARGPVAGPPAVFGVIRPGPLLAAPRSEAAPADGAGTRPGPETEARDGETAAAERGGGVPLPRMFSGGRGALARLLGRLAGSSGRGTGEGPAGGETRVGAVRAVPAVRHGRPVRGRPGGPGAGAALRRRGLAYPEWDAGRGRYRDGWCMVTETGPARPGRAVAADRRVLRRPLARLGLGLERHRRRAQGDDLDLDAVVEARADPRGGEAVYVESLRRRHELAVLVLLDVSGSAGLPSPAGGTVHERQIAAAAALLAALHDLGGRVALYGFSSGGRSDVRVVRVKSFDDRLDTAAARRLGGLVPGAYTRMGAAVRHGTALLAERGGTPRRLLVVVSDGLAYDRGYEGAYAEADARKALAEARREGIGCVCVTVGADAEPAALRRVFGPAAHAAVAGPAELAALAGPLFRDALRSAVRPALTRTTPTRTGRNA